MYPQVAAAEGGTFGSKGKGEGMTNASGGAPLILLVLALALWSVQTSTHPVINTVLEEDMFVQAQGDNSCLTLPQPSDGPGVYTLGTRISRQRSSSSTDMGTLLETAVGRLSAIYTFVRTASAEFPQVNRHTTGYIRHGMDSPNIITN